MSISLQRIIIASTKIDHMADFYGALLETAFQKVDCGDFHFYEGATGGIKLRLFPASIAGIQAEENRHQLTFSVDSIAAAVERGEAHRGTLQDDIQDHGDARVCSLRDPDGNTIELVETADS